MRLIALFFILTVSFNFVSFANESLDSLVKNLYSDSFQMRSRAATALSATRGADEIQKIISKFHKEFSCVNEKLRPEKCHDPKFIYNAILVAGNLAQKDRQAPWDFLVNLWRGKTINEGSFFQVPQEGDAFRGVDYFSPRENTSKPRREELVAFLEKTIQSTLLWASCQWPWKMIVELSKKKTFGNYQIYTYDRDYSPEIQDQYKVRNSISWIYRGDKKISCGAANEIVDLKSQGEFAVFIEDKSGESITKVVSIYSIPENKELCSYTIESMGSDPLKLFHMKSDLLLQTFFELTPKSCRPKKLPDYSVQ